MRKKDTRGLNGWERDLNAGHHFATSAHPLTDGLRLTESTLLCRNGEHGDGESGNGDGNGTEMEVEIEMGVELTQKDSHHYNLPRRTIHMTKIEICPRRRIMTKSRNRGGKSTCRLYN